jgi:serine/threonine-protein kinase RsbW
VDATLSSGTVIVSVPPRAEFVHVLRSVTATVAARIRLSIDAVDDLRLAVDEACARLLAIHSPASSLSIGFGLHGDRLEVTVWLEAAVADWPPAGFEESLSWKLLAALVVEARPDMTRRGPAIRMVKRTLDPSEIR